MQAAHAALEAGIRLPQDPAAEPSHLVLCGVASEAHLIFERDRLTRAGILTYTFTEPDRANQATAVATQPLAGDDRRPCRRLTMWRQPENT